MTILTQLEKVTGMLIVSASLANNLDANIYAGRSSSSIELPCVVCVGESAEPLIYKSGWYKCNVTVQVQERAVDTAVADILAQTVYDAFGRTDLANVLVTYSTSSLVLAPDIEVRDLRQSVGTDDKSWVQELNLEVIGGLR